MGTIQTTLQKADQLKEQINQCRPLPKEALEKIQQALEVEYTYDSNRIEGNTLTLQETALVVSEGVTISGKSMREHLEAVNHAQAIEFIKEAATGKVEITEHLIKELHALVLHGINKEEAGKYRNVPVMIVGSRHIPPQPYMIAPLMEQFIRDYEDMENNRLHPILIAAFLHNELVKIHPFIDGNGRTSRLLMNLYLLAHDYTIANIRGDNESKMLYYKALETSHTENNREPFNQLVADEVMKALERYLEILSC